LVAAFLSLAMGFLAGFGLHPLRRDTNTLIQITTRTLPRRMMSLYTLMFVGTAPIGALVSGAIAAALRSARRDFGERVRCSCAARSG